MLRPQDLLLLLDKKERFVVEWAVAVLREIGPDSHPGEAELLALIKGVALPLPFPALRTLLEGEKDPLAVMVRVKANLIERDRLLLRLFERCHDHLPRERLLRPLNALAGGSPAAGSVGLGLGGSAEGACFAAVLRLMLGQREAREQVMGGFDKLSRMLRWSVVVSLAASGDLAHLSLFISALEDSEAAVVQEAVAAIGHLGAHAAIDEVMVLLGHSREEVVLAAVRTLAAFRDQRAALPLLKLMAGTRSHRVRATVISALGVFAETRTIPVLSRYLGHSDERVRANAVVALAGKFQLLGQGDPEVLARIRELRRDPSHRVRADAICSLWQLGEVDSLTEIEALLASAEPSERASGAYLVGRLKLLQLRDALVTCAGDREWSVRKLAALSLLALGEPGRGELRHLLEKGSEPQRMVAAYALSLAGHGDAQGLLLWSSRQGGEEGAQAAELLALLTRGDDPGLPDGTAVLDPDA